VSSLIERSPDVLSRRVGAVWLVTTPDDPDVHELSGGAAIVWERLDDPSSIDAVTEALMLAGAESPDLRSDVEHVFRSLQDLGVLREAQTAAPNGDALDRL